jgi:hypothetical protein
MPVIAHSIPDSFSVSRTAAWATDSSFVPDLIVPDRPFPGLRVKGVTAHPGVFEMT